MAVAGLVSWAAFDPARDWRSGWWEQRYGGSRDAMRDAEL